MLRFLAAVALAVMFIAGCSDQPAPANRAEARSGDVPETAGKAAPPLPAEPARPAKPGAPPGDRTPPAEARFDARSAQGAARIVHSYYALIEAGRYGEARRLWSGGGDASGKTEADFAADFARYRAYHADIGAPGRVEGAAGSSYVEVPVLLSGRLKDGSPFRQPATVTLRRVDDVPGATAEQRSWHIKDVAAGDGPEE